jgi:hypothetical protein
MRLTTIALAAAFALASTLAAQAAHKHRSHHRGHHSAATNSPNGTAGGPTSLSGTGTSQYGGSVPGATGKN